MQPFAKNMAVEFADKAIPGGEIATTIEGINTDIDALETTVGDSSSGLVKQVADLEEAVVAKGFVGTATIVKPSDFALSELPTEVGFYKVNSAYQGYQGIMYVQTVGEHTSGYGMCANGKYYSFEDSVDLTMKDSFEFDGVVRIIQTGGSTYGIKVPGEGVYLVKSVRYGVGPGAGILYSSTPAAAGTQLIQGITVDGQIYKFTAQLGSTVNIEFKPAATKLYEHSIMNSSYTRMLKVVNDSPAQITMSSGKLSGLINNSVNVLVKGDSGLTPIIYASSNAPYEIAHYLKSDGTFGEVNLEWNTGTDIVTPL